MNMTGDADGDGDYDFFSSSYQSRRQAPVVFVIIFWEKHTFRRNPVVETHFPALFLSISHIFV